MPQIEDVVNLRETLNAMSSSRVIHVNPDARQSGRRGDSSRPFRSIALGLAAFEPGYALNLAPGSYNERITLPAGSPVRICGEEADLIYTGTAQGGIIDDSALYGSNGAISGRIQVGDILYSTAHTSQAGNYSTTPVRVTNASSDIEIICRNLKSNVVSAAAQSAAAYVLNGKATIRVAREWKSLAYDAAIIDTNSTATLIGYFDELLGGDNCLEWLAGNVYMEGRRAYSSGSGACINAGWAVEITGNMKLKIGEILANTGIVVNGTFNTNGQDWIDARYIANTSTASAVDIESGTLTIFNARIKAGGASAVGVNLSGTPTLCLDNCRVISGASATEGVAGTGNLQMLGGLSNKAKGAGVTVTAGAYATADADLV